MNMPESADIKGIFEIIKNVWGWIAKPLSLVVCWVFFRFRHEPKFEKEIGADIREVRNSANELIRRKQFYKPIILNWLGHICSDWSQLIKNTNSKNNTVLNALRLYSEISEKPDEIYSPIRLLMRTAQQQRENSGNQVQDDSIVAKLLQTSYEILYKDDASKNKMPEDIKAHYMLSIKMLLLNFLDAPQMQSVFGTFSEFHFDNMELKNAARINVALYLP